MPVFNWNYLSFYDFDATWLYREVVLIPVLLAILWVIWMKVVRSSLKDVLGKPEAMSLQEAYATAVINEALDTDDDDDDEEERNEEQKSKSDLNASEEDKKTL